MGIRKAHTQRRSALSLHKGGVGRAGKCGHKKSTYTKEIRIESTQGRSRAGRSGHKKSTYAKEVRIESTQRRSKVGRQEWTHGTAVLAFGFIFYSFNDL